MTLTWTCGWAWRAVPAWQLRARDHPERWENKAGIRTARTQLGWAGPLCLARGCTCGHT